MARISSVAFILIGALGYLEPSQGQLIRRPDAPAPQAPQEPVKLGAPETARAGVEAAKAGAPDPGKPKEAPADYILGPDDQISLWTPEADELNGKVMRIEGNGQLRIPLVGTIKAAGQTPSQLSVEISKRLERYYQNPQVVVSVSEYRSQAVSVIGAVNNPGVHQLQGRKTLVEMLSMAGGLRQDAGPTVVITRRSEYGPIPLEGATEDESHSFSTVQIDLKSVTSAARPQDNIAIKPNDVIAVQKARMVYVIGEVERSGGFVLNEREGVSVLQALSLAGGLKSTASAKNARILRQKEENAAREEMPVNLSLLLEGKAGDVDLRPDDILFIPNSRSKSAAIRAAEAAIQTLTGVVIWRSSR